MGYKDFQIVDKKPFPWCWERELQWGAVTVHNPMIQLRSLIQNPAHKFSLHKAAVCMVKCHLSHQPRPRTKQLRKSVPTECPEMVILAQIWLSVTLCGKQTAINHKTSTDIFIQKINSRMRVRCSFIALSCRVPLHYLCRSAIPIQPVSTSAQRMQNPK